MVLLAAAPPARRPMIYPDFPLDLTGFFSGKHLVLFLANKMQDFRNFVPSLHSQFFTLDKFT